MKAIDRYLDRSLARKMAVADERNAALCVGNMDSQPGSADFWLSEAKRYAARARDYRARAKR